MIREYIPPKMYGRASSVTYKLRRVVVTGMGIISSIGLNIKEVLHSLQHQTSGIRYNPVYKEMGLRSLISGHIPQIDTAQHIARKHLRFMADAAIYAYLALQQAIKDAKLTDAEVSDAQTGIIAGSGGASSANQVEAADVLRHKGVKRVGPYRVTKCMSNTVSACLAGPFRIKGLNMSISSACSTSAHCISMAADQIRLGRQKIIFAGGGEEEHWTVSALFDGMGALSTGFNDSPERASRPWDKERDGFVISGGGGFVVLEDLEHAQKRGAHIYAEVKDYAANSDGNAETIVAPTGEGAVRCMQGAVKDAARTVDYINAHATSTPVGDEVELDTIRKVFGKHKPYISATKSLTGHALGAAGVHECIYSLLMMANDFIAGTLNLENVNVPDLRLVKKTLHNIKLNNVVSNSFGFGGTNSCILFSKYQ